MEHTKDYSLLRPFDLDAAKAGALLCSESAILNGEPVWKYAAGPDASGRIVAVKISDGNFAEASRPEAFRMAPLAWVEGRPVYKGDVLYAQNAGRRIAVGVDGKHLRLVTEDGMPWGLFIADHVTWTPPKVKHQGWGVIRINPNGLHTREEAEALLKQFIGMNPLSLSDVMQGEPRVVYIEWEEPAC